MYSVSLTEKFAFIPPKWRISLAYSSNSLQYWMLSLVMSVMYLNLMPLALISDNNFLYCSTSKISEGALESPQESILSALDKNCSIVLITCSSPDNTSVLSVSLVFGIEFITHYQFNR